MLFGAALMVRETAVSMRWNPPGRAKSGHLFRNAYARRAAADDNRHDGADQQATREEAQPGLESVGGIVPEPAHRERSDETAEIADGIDEGDAACRRDARQVAG